VPDVVNYTGAVPYNMASVRLTPTAADANATIRVNGVLVSSGTASQDIPLVVGGNTITVLVTAQDGTRKFYLVVVYRASNEKYIRVVPNPVVDRKLQIKFVNIDPGKYNVLVYTVLGQLVHRSSIKHDGGSSIYIDNLPALSNTYYIVRVQNWRMNHAERVLIKN
jgi:hypothetical protein